MKLHMMGSSYNKDYAVKVDSRKKNDFSAILKAYCTDNNFTLTDKAFSQFVWHIKDFRRVTGNVTYCFWLEACNET